MLLRLKKPVKSGVLLAGLSLGLGASVWAGQAVSPMRSVWDGVYTAEQAARGKAVYDTTCSNCHGGDLRGGGGTARSLGGSRFYQDWGEDSLQSLFALTRATMPRPAIGSLSDETYLDIIAYILQINEYPAGDAVLTTSNVESVRIIRKEGPGPVPNFALVTVVGCLTRSAKGVWSLTNGTEPVRTRNPEPSQGAERQRALDAAPGAHTFELMDVYRAGDGHEGHKMEIKGLLIRGAIDRVNLTGIQMLDANCGQ